jgi:hypothetical protein
MPYTYPPAAPTLSGDVETISRFLNSPTLVARRLRTLAEQRYIADTLLSGRSRCPAARCCTRPVRRSSPRTTRVPSPPAPSTR